LQTKKFDPKGVYIKKFAPEYFSGKFPQPIVAHEFARVRALDTYKKALNRQN